MQRLLWASTGTKNKTYSDVLYVEELIAPDTVNTVPPATMDAFRDHGKVRASLEENIDAGRSRRWRTLERSGISIDAVTAKLVEDGVQLFADAFDKLLGAVAQQARRRCSATGSTARPSSFPPSLRRRSRPRSKPGASDGNVRRLWAGDAGCGPAPTRRNGSAGSASSRSSASGSLRVSKLCRGYQAQDFTHVVLLGMGGSSLGPEVFAETFGRQNGHPELLVLDSTDPAQIRTIESKIDPARTLFIVSSKSGSTLEPNILKQYFFECAKRAVGADKAGSRFIAITDPGSKLQDVAERDGSATSRSGSRASAAATRCCRISAWCRRPRWGSTSAGCSSARRSWCAPAAPTCRPPTIRASCSAPSWACSERPGRDKVTIVASPGIADFGAWLEQLLAESTGKQGKGLIPVDAEPLGAARGLRPGPAVRLSAAGGRSGRGAG